MVIIMNKLARKANGGGEGTGSTKKIREGSRRHRGDEKENLHGARMLRERERRTLRVRQEKPARGGKEMRGM